MPYLNPSLVPGADTATFRSICVFVPDKPEYTAALLGSLSYLATWAAWERDAEQTAKKSALLWRLANNLTLASWNEECDCMSFDCESMKECLIEVAKSISINVTVNNTCGGGGGGASLYCVNDNGDVIVNPPPVTDDPVTPVYPLPDGLDQPPLLDPGDDPPDGWDTWDDYDQDACDAANALVDWAANSLQRIYEMVNEDIYGLTAIFALLVNLYSFGWGKVLSSAMLLKLGELIRNIWDNTEWLSDVTTTARDYVVENRQELVCELYANRYEAGEWENRLVDIIFTASSGGIASINERPLWLDVLKYLLPGYTSLQVLYGSLTYQNDANFVDCACLPGCQDCSPNRIVMGSDHEAGISDDTLIAIGLLAGEEFVRAGRPSLEQDWAAGYFVVRPSGGGYSAGCFRFKTAAPVCVCVTARMQTSPANSDGRYAAKWQAAGPLNSTGVSLDNAIGEYPLPIDNTGFEDYAIPVYGSWSESTPYLVIGPAIDGVINGNQKGYYVQSIKIGLGDP